MNEITKNNNLEANIENISNENFTEKEKLVAKSILITKAYFGITSRLSIFRKYFLDLKELQKAEQVLIGQTALKKLTRTENDLTKQYATELGISKDRFREIENWVYEHETNL